MHQGPIHNVTDHHGQGFSVTDHRSNEADWELALLKLNMAGITKRTRLRGSANTQIHCIICITKRHLCCIISPPLKIMP